MRDSGAARPYPRGASCSLHVPFEISELHYLTSERHVFNRSPALHRHSTRRVSSLCARSTDVIALDLAAANQFGCQLGSAAILAGAHPYQKRSEKHTSELQSLMRTAYAVFCLKKKK